MARPTVPYHDYTTAKAALEGMSRNLSESIATMLETDSVSLEELVDARMCLEVPLAGRQESLRILGFDPLRAAQVQPSLLPERTGVTLPDYRKWMEAQVELLNHALRGFPEERIRFHTCYGVNVGPRLCDLQLDQGLDLMLRIRAGAFSFEAANPRHAHEWQVFETVKLPEGKVLIPGVLESKSNFIEHPELIAQRLVRYAKLVGRENVIAGA